MDKVSAFKKLPDLTIKILSLQAGGGCPTGQGSCKYNVELKVTNLSNEPVNTPFNIKTNSHNGLLTTQTIPFIPGSPSQTLTAVWVRVTVVLTLIAKLTQMKLIIKILCIATEYINYFFLNSLFHCCFLIYLLLV